MCKWVSECVAYEFVRELVCAQHINSVNGHENRIFMKNDLSLMREFIIQIKKNRRMKEILMKKRHSRTLHTHTHTLTKMP